MTHIHNSHKSYTNTKKKYFFLSHVLQFPVLFLGETEISEEKKKSLEEGFDFLDIFLKDSPWVAGQNRTIADCACAASVSTIVVRFSLLSV